MVIKMLKAVFFDLDGTLLPLDEEKFMKLYFDNLYESVKNLEYKKEELIKTIWDGTARMYQNNGSKTNEMIFWDEFSNHYGKDKLKDQKYFDEFYDSNFKNTIYACKENNLAKAIIDFVHKTSLKCILSTNPIFPKKATLTRMGFVNLKEEDFDFITTYENFSYCKPNPKYFLELLKIFNLKEDEVIIFGNNDVEDYLCAKNANIKCYLVKGNLILHNDKHLNPPIIEMNEIIDIIKQEISKQ